MEHAKLSPNIILNYKNEETLLLFMNAGMSDV